MTEEDYVAQGLSVVGYFHANQRFDEVELCGVAKNIGDHISHYFPQAPILLLNNKKLEALSKGEDRSPVIQFRIVYLNCSSNTLRLGHQASISFKLTVFLFFLKH